jgi:RimJ/RimL family protein N-acetyltransferase
MSDARRYEYVLDVSEPVAVPPQDFAVRRPEPGDAELLAELMLDAYLDTIDYEGESLEEARAEVGRYLAGSPLLECSWLSIADGRPVSASLVSFWSERDCPIVSYVMTAASWKSKGLASALLARSLASLAEAGSNEVRAAITEGNVPSVKIFTRAGFRRV